MSEQEITENKYNRGKVYKLVSFQTDKVYVGSTCEQYLSNRLAGHRRNYKRYQNGKQHYITSFEITKFDDVDIILLENFSCNSKQELHSRERYYIESLDCVNKNVPTRTAQEYAKTDKVKTYQKAYAKTDKAKTYRKEYQKTDKVRAYDKAYKSKKIKCECGCEVRWDSQFRHNKTRKHQKYLQQIQDTNKPIEIIQ